MVKYWFVRHNMQAYKEHSDRIGREQTRAAKIRHFRNLTKGDKIIYYAKDTQKIIGLFEIASDTWVPFEGSNTDIEWGGRTLCYEIKPLYIPSKPIEFSAKALGLSPLEPRVTVARLSYKQYERIKSFILGIRDPVNHEGVVALFSKIHRELGYSAIKEIRTAFPDAIVEDAYGNEKRIEFEFKSMNFEKEGHKAEDCDEVVCWEDDWGAAAKLKVVELKRFIYG